MTKKSFKQKSLAPKRASICSKKGNYFILDNKIIHTSLLSNKIRQSIMELYNANILPGQSKCDNSNMKSINV